jgi:hypothetical protein
LVSSRLFCIFCSFAFFLHDYASASCLLSIVAACSMNASEMDDDVGRADPNAALP